MATARFCIFVSLILGFQNVNAQIYHWFDLPKRLEEVSAAVHYKSRIWMLNDSGNPPEIFEYAEDSLLGSYPVDGENIDWEAMTTDGINLYIGDIGNNNNDRNQRTIYIVPLDRLDGQYDSIQPQIITVDVPMPDSVWPSRRDFDWESLVYFRGYLYTFSKNRREPFDGEIVSYRWQAEPGRHRAEAVDTNTWDGTLRELHWVTDAALSPDQRHLALLTSNKLAIYSDFPGNRFLEGRREIIHLDPPTQKESVTFLSDSTLMVADEENPVFGGGSTFGVNIAKTLRQHDDLRRNEINWQNPPVTDSLYSFSVHSVVEAPVYIAVYNDAGERVMGAALGMALRDTKVDFSLDISHLQVGIYMMNVQVGAVPHGRIIYKKPRD